VCGRRAEDRHHRVADELLDGASVALEHLPETRVVRPDASADVLRVSFIRSRGEADEVAEEDRDDLALLALRRRRLAGQRRSAVWAEREVAWEFSTAGRAG